MNKQLILKQYILEEIRMGKWNSGDKIFSRAQFMKKFQVARATVDAVIEDLNQAKVLDCEKGRGTFVASKRNKTKTKTLFIITQELNENSMPSIMAHSMLQTLQSPYQVEFLNYEQIAEPDHWNKCKEGSFLVFVMPNALHFSYMYDCHRNHIPFTVMYRDPPDYSYVSIDNRGSSSSLVSKLKNKGFKHIGYFGLLEGKYHFPEERYAGFLEGLLENNLSFQRNFSGFATNENLQIELRKFLMQKKLPEVLICSFISIQDLLIVMESLKLKPGKDLSIASLNPEDHKKYPFELPCMQYALKEIGAKMGQLVTQKISNPLHFEQIKIKPKPF